VYIQKMSIPVNVFTGHVPAYSGFVRNCHWLRTGACSKMEEQRQVFTILHMMFILLIPCICSLSYISLTNQCIIISVHWLVKEMYDILHMIICVYSRLSSTSTIESFHLHFTDFFKIE
jgi:hypothetical protein